MVAERRSKTRALPTEDAYARAESIVERHASNKEWDRPIPPEIDRRLTTLEPRLADLLRRFRRIHFPDDDFSTTELSAELLDAPPPTAIPHGHMTVGISLPDPWALTTRSGDDPRVYEVINGQVREEYPSIAHFILLTQGPD